MTNITIRIWPDFAAIIYRYTFRNPAGCLPSGVGQEVTLLRSIIWWYHALKILQPWSVTHLVPMGRNSNVPVLRLAYDGRQQKDMLTALDSGLKRTTLLLCFVAVPAPLKFGGERIVFSFVCAPNNTNLTFWVLDKATREVRGDSEPNFLDRVRCHHKFDDIPADYLWGYERVVVGAPLELHCEIVREPRQT